MKKIDVYSKKLEQAITISISDNGLFSQVETVPGVYTYWTDGGWTKGGKDGDSWMDGGWSKYVGSWTNGGWTKGGKDGDSWLDGGWSKYAGNWMNGGWSKDGK